MDKPKFAVFNDGILILWRSTKARGAPGIDPSSTAGLESVIELCFANTSVRQEDVELAEAAGSRVTRKAKVRDMPSITPELSVTINNELYEIARVDRSNEFAWLHLDEVLSDGTAKLDGQEVFCRKRTWSAAEANSAGSMTLRPTVTVTVRAEDWNGQARLERAGKRYTIISAISKGKWVELKAEQKASDRR